MSETPYNHLRHKETIIKIITAFHPEAKVYLFGSFSRGENRPGSDIDVAFDIGRRTTIHEWQFLQNLLNTLSAPRIDLVDIHRVPVEMRNDIITKGVVWKN